MNTGVRVLTEREGAQTEAEAAQQALRNVLVKGMEMRNACCAWFNGDKSKATLATAKRLECEFDLICKNACRKILRQDGQSEQEALAL